MYRTHLFNQRDHVLVSRNVRKMIKKRVPRTVTNSFLESGLCCGSEISCGYHNKAKHSSHHHDVCLTQPIVHMRHEW